MGHTSDVERRLREHNNKEPGKQRYTRKQQGPWLLIYSEEMPSRSEAMEREIFLKSGIGHYRTSIRTIRDIVKGQVPLSFWRFLPEIDRYRKRSF
ncbi:MAG: GIY-YIG nuclease family protein [Proteobacteria bacterium]|nr:GIY-YIG nuclease family protein [Pseudomonadota bacterium]